MKRISLIGSNLRHRSDDFKSQLVSRFNKEVTPLFENQQVRPIIDKTFKIDFQNPQDVALVEEAHRYMESNQNIGKIVLEFDGKD